jgi:hypothetical protein
MEFKDKHKAFFLFLGAGILPRRNIRMKRKCEMA